MTAASKVVTRRPPGPPWNTSPVQRDPEPPKDSEDGGDGGEWTHLTTAANAVVAHLIEGRLSEEGILCVLDHFNPSPGAWLKPFGDPLAPVKIYVRRHNFAAASIVLHEIGHQAPDPLDEGPPSVKGLWLVTILIVIIVTFVSLFDMFFGNLVWP